MKINKPLIRKMIKRIETIPESYCQAQLLATENQRPWLFVDRPVPKCGTVACLAGEAVICSERSVSKGLAKLHQSRNAVDLAERLMGVTDAQKWIFRMSQRNKNEPLANIREPL